MNKMKAKKLKLKPTARDNRRYFMTSATNESIEKAILEYLGVLEFAKSVYMQVKDEGILNKTVGSVDRKMLNDVRAALTFAKIKIERVSNTIKGLRG